MLSMPAGAQYMPVHIPTAMSALCDRADDGGDATPVAASAVTVDFEVFDGGTGNPLPGARVSVIGDKATVLTGDDGKARLAVPNSTVTVAVSAPGFQTVELGVRSRYGMSVTLNPTYNDALAIGETVADQSVADLNGDLYAISRSGMPGAGYAVFVDGIHSVNTSSQPIYVVDGQVWQPDENKFSIIEGFSTNPLALIDPKDIESVKVMRDGSAIYGAKGANGVVVIETRRAHNEATVIEAFANFGSRQKIKSIPVMGASDYRLYATDVLAGYDKQSLVEKFSFLNDDPTSTSYLGSHANTDWLDGISRNAILMNYGINVRGGDDRALYGFSLGYTKNEAPIKDTSFDRLNIRFNSDINLWTGFKLRFDVAFAQATTHMFDDGLNEISAPYYMSLVKSPLYSSHIYSTSGLLTNKLSDVDELGVGNPLSIFDLGEGESRNYRFNLIASPSYKFNDSWTVRATVGYIFDKDKENTFLPDYGVYDRRLVNNTGESYFTIKQEIKNLMNRRTTFSADAHVEFTPLRDYRHNLKVFAGYRYQNDTWNMSYGHGYNSGSDHVNDLHATNSNYYESDGFDLRWQNMAWYANVDYALLSRYIFSASAVMESSSRFGYNAARAMHIGNNSWGLFPSVSAAWVISNEDFMANATWLDLLKLRLSYAVTGNDNLPLNATSTFFASTAFLGNYYGYTLNSIGNERLKWESTSTARAAIEAAFLNNRLAFTLEGYISNTKDLLMQKQLRDVAGIDTYWTNGGRMRNRGVNFSVNGRVVNTRDWHLDLGAMIGMYRNKVTSLADGDFDTTIAGATVRTAVGHPVGVFYGFKTDGVLINQEEADAASLYIINKDGSRTYYAAGDMKFVENKVDGRIDDNDRFIIGDPTPDFYGNFNFRLNWKRLTLSSIFTYSVGNDVYNALRANLESGSDIHNQSTAMNARWRANNQQTDMPRATYGDPMGNARFSDRWIEDGSYLKWKSLALTYELPIRSTVIQGLSFTFSMSNIMTWTKYLGPDPEFYSGSSPLYMGIDSGLIPSSREFNFGVKINL